MLPEIHHYVVLKVISTPTKTSLVIINSYWLNVWKDPCHWSSFIPSETGGVLICSAIQKETSGIE